MLPNGMIPVATSVGMMLGFAMTGTIIVETIFNIPGLGTLLNTSINMYDYNLTQGIVVVCAMIICGVNLAYRYFMCPPGPPAEGPVYQLREKGPPPGKRTRQIRRWDEMKKSKQAAAAKETGRKSRGQGAEIWHRLRKNKFAMGALVFIMLLVLAVAFAEYLTPYDYQAVDLAHALEFPSLEHPMGTDQYGRDLLTRRSVAAGFRADCADYRGGQRSGCRRDRHQRRILWRLAGQCADALHGCADGDSRAC